MLKYILLCYQIIKIYINEKRSKFGSVDYGLSLMERENQLLHLR
jgi:hypothetical protein